MADALKFEKKARPEGKEISAALREFVEKVIVPALVREWNAERNNPNILASANYSVANSAANDPLSREAIR
jgi:hypothetical protein